MAVLATYADFSKGEYGLLGAWRAPDGSFTGRNVQRYDDGSIGPRVGLQTLAVTGIPAGPILAMGLGKQSAGPLRVWFVKGTTVYAFDPDAPGAVITYTGALTSAPRASAAPSFVTKQEKTYFFNGTDGRLYKIDHNLATVTNVLALTTGSPTADVKLIQYGVHTLWSTSIDRRLRYSAVDNPESWPAGNFLDIGEEALGIVGLFAQRTHLTICKTHGGFLPEWYTLTGVLGVDAVLRPTLITTTPMPNFQAGITGEGDIAFISINQDRTPHFYNGSMVDVVRHLQEPYLEVQYTQSVPLWYPSDVAHIARGVDGSPHRILLYRNGTWTRHKLEIGSGVRPRAMVVPVLGSDFFIFSTDGDSLFYKWEAYNNSPTANNHGTVLTPATPDDCAFTLPEWWSKDDQEVRVSAVTVDFRTYAVGGTNTFNVTVTPLRLYEGTDGAPATFTFSEAAPGADRNQRRQATFLVEHGNGFQVKISNLRGVAIQKITVHSDEPNRPHGAD